jgi:hypothetical protein
LLAETLLSKDVQGTSIMINGLLNAGF